MKTSTLILLACLICLLVAAVNTDCMAHKIYSVRTGDYVYHAVAFAAFVMAFVALFRRGK